MKTIRWRWEERDFGFRFKKGISVCVHKGEVAPYLRSYNYTSLSFFSTENKTNIFTLKEKKYKNNEVEVVFQVMTVPPFVFKKAPAGVWVTYNNQGVSNKPSSITEKDIKRGIGEPSEKDQFLQVGHPLLENTPDLIDFEATVEMFLTQVHEMNFNSPVLVPVK